MPRSDSRGSPAERRESHHTAGGGPLFVPRGTAQGLSRTQLQGSDGLRWVLRENELLGWLALRFSEGREIYRIGSSLLLARLSRAQLGFWSRRHCNLSQLSVVVRCKWKQISQKYQKPVFLSKFGNRLNTPLLFFFMGYSIPGNFPMLLRGA